MKKISAESRTKPNGVSGNQYVTAAMDELMVIFHQFGNQSGDV